MQNAAERKAETEKIQKFLASEEFKIKDSKVQVEDELREVQPLIDMAKQAVEGISKQNLDWLRSLKMPPQPIHDVMGAVLLIFGNQDTSWNNMKKFLGQSSVIKNIIDFDPRVMTQDLRRDVQAMIQQHSSSFESANIYRASAAAGPMVKGQGRKFLH